MARTYNPFAANPYPTDPAWGQIGSSLATALFGDPELQAQAQLRRAQMEQLAASAAYDRSRTTGQDLTNSGLTSLQEAMLHPERFATPNAAPAAVPTAPAMPSVSYSGVSAPAAAPASPVSSLIESMIPITIKAESGGNPNAVSPKGATGLMQTMPMTTRDPGFGVRPSNGTPEDNVRLGRDYLSAMLGRYKNDPAKAWAAYNAGPGRLDRAIAMGGDAWINHVPAETRAYVRGNTARLGANVAPPSAGGGSAAPAATVSAPTLAPEEQGNIVDRNALTGLAIAAALGNRESAITPLVQAILAMGGGDQNMRQALVAGGQQPGKDFAADRTGQFNNMALDQYGDLSKAIAGENLQQAGQTQREVMSQAGQDRRNAADNVQSNTNNIRDNQTKIQTEGMKAGPNGGKLPVGAQKLQDEHLNVIGQTAGVDAILGGIVRQIDSGKLKLGPWENILSEGANWAGASNENSRNYQSFKSNLEKMRNQTLLLNKGVQTEGDAQRALKELMDNLNDPKVVKQRLKEIQEINRRAIALRQQQVAQIRADNGLADIDYSRFTNPGAVRPPLSSFRKP